MLAQIFGPVAGQWELEYTITNADNQTDTVPLPFPFQNMFNLMNLIVVMDILGVYCVWCERN